MGFKKNKGVTLKIDQGFFDNVFEPNRKALEKKLGVRVTQPKFSQMIKGFKLNLKISEDLKDVRVKKFKKK